jgi:hypothetical protein
MVVSIIVALALAIAVGVLVLALRKARSERDLVREEHERLTERFRPVVDADAERKRVLDELAAEQVLIRAAIENEQKVAAEDLAKARRERDLNIGEVSSLQSHIEALQTEFSKLDEESNLQSFGFYKPRYDFADSKQYQARLELIRESQKAMLKTKTAATCPIEWTVNGSKVEGRKSTNQTLKLMLRAFNGECDAATAKVKYNNVHVMEARINKAHEMINGLAEVNQCHIAELYRDYKLQELHLTHEYEEKLQEEKEEQRRIREQMREEEIAQREIEKARQDAEREEGRFTQALAKAREEVEKAVGAKQAKLQGEIEELQRRLSEAQANKERAIARAQMTRSGHVYIISNIGSFGEHVYKIGMTRRLDPMDRIHELSDASVPFHFDVHAIIFCEDAPSLETRLHQTFNRRRTNRVNNRKEFFNVAIEDIAAAVQEHHGSIEFTLAAEAVEYRKTQAILADEHLQTLSLQPDTARLRIAENPGQIAASATEPALVSTPAVSP